tara:strand:+ start:268 stop:480 length:213 start_codon:yes stop_codon:yes gene_type:complete
MKCSKKMSVKIPTIERCKEMILGFENQINETFKTNVKYEGKERELLIKTIQDNPTHFWEVTIDGLIYYAI